MIDKVIKGLEHCTTNLGCYECPYSKGTNKGTVHCKLYIDKDALAVLKDIDTQIQYRDDIIAEYEKEINRLNAMLKQQEAKQAIKQTYHVMINSDYENPVEVTRYDWLCPNCKSLLCRDVDVIDDNYHFCKVCGQAVNWK